MSQKLPDEACVIRGVESTELVFRYDETRPLSGEYITPRIAAERPEIPTDWTDLAPEAAEAHVLAGGNLAVFGLAGTGKTFWAKQLVAKLRDTMRVDIVAKTHIACQNFGDGAVTADHWVRKYARRGGCPCKCLVVEEFSQISAYLWNDLAVCLHKGVQFVLLGDPGQLEPIKDSFAGCPVRTPLSSSDLFYELAGGVKMTLSENRRSDPPLFLFYSSLQVGLPGERPLAEALAEAKQTFPLKQGHPNHTLCLSHRTRLEINKAQNAQRPEGAILYKANKRQKLGENAPQDMWLWPGLQMVGAVGPIKNGIFAKISEVTQEHVTLEGGLRLSKDAACSSLRLAYCLTFAACQGLTLQGRVRLITGHSALTIRHLYVGASRTTKAKLLEVC